MPTFQTISQQEAELETAMGVRAQRMKEYLGYLDQAGNGQAGMLMPEGDETPTAVTRRLRAAAETAGVRLVVKRAGDAVYFWRQSRGSGWPRRRGGFASSD